MTVSVVFAAKLPESHVLSRYALPKGFPFLIEEETMTILEPVLEYLYETHVTAVGSRWKYNTTEADAYDLRDWFDFLENHESEGTGGKAWDLASHHDYLAYHEALQDLVSRKTKKHLAHRTILRRQIAVERLYAWAEKRRLYIGPFIERTVQKGRQRPPKDRDELAHIRSRQPATGAVPEGRHRLVSGETVHPLTAREWRRLQDELGPLPSKSGDADPRACRSRLAAELSTLTGMRVDEVASLTTAQVGDLISQLVGRSADELSRSYFKLHISKTKGLVPRDVLVPAYLVLEMETYAKSERANSVAVGRIHAEKLRRIYKEPQEFFLNLPDIPHFAGRRVTAATLSDDFRTSCIGAGLLKTEQRFDPDDPSQVQLVKVASHTYHDTRHTFASFQYRTEVANGNSEPWKKIQTLLGHRSLKVTMDTYLKVIDVHRESVGQEQWDHLIGLRGPRDA